MKQKKRLLAIIIVVVIVLLAAPLEGFLGAPSLLKGLVNDTSLTAFASTNYDHNVSYNPVTNNYDNGGFPTGLNYCYENETIYFNFCAGTEVYVRKATYHLSRNGQSNYLTGTRTPDNSYFRYCWFSLSLPDGSYSLYWDIEYSAPNYNSNIGSFTTDTYTFTVYDPEIIPSRSTVNLNLDGTKTATIYMTCHGVYDYINYTSQTSNCTVNEGSWDNDRLSFIITATALGSSTLDFNLRNSSNSTIATTSVTVNVTENTYTLSYNANGGSGAPSSQSGAKSYTVSSTVPSYFGKTFLGWSKSSSATSASYTPGNSISLSGNTTLYAVWKSAESLSLGSNKSVTISFANQERYYTFKPSSSGTYSFESTGNLDTKAYLYSSSGSELKNDDDSGDGNNFKLEYDLSSGTTYYLKVRAYSTYIGSSTFSVNKNVTSHTVTYNYSYNGGTSATKTSATVAEGAAIDLTPTATKSGWTFVGWNTNSSATTALSSLTMSTSNVTLYAVYKKTLTGTFVDYSGTSKTTRTVSTTIYNNATSGTVTAPTQNTYTGWTTRGWTTGTSANASTVSSYSISANTTFYGLYQRTLTLSYNANGGSSTPSSQTGTQYTNSYSISSTKNPSFTLANAISKSGYTFDGWAMGSTSGTKYSAGSSITISANTTMYATWTLIPTATYTLSYNANGGSGAPTSQSGATSYTVSSTVPTYFGKTFLGWSKSSSATSASYTPGNSISLSGNTTLYAVWKSAESLSLGSNKSVTISFANQERYYTFKPSSSGTYSFESTGNLDTKAYLYSSSGSELKNNDDSGEGNNFKIDYDLSSGTTYYLKVRAYSTNTGSSTFSVNKNVTSHTVTYNYSYNGGDSATKTSATVAEGAAIDLTPTATKSGWTFVGWNTSSSATTGLSSKTMGTSNVTLYAIYKKTLTGTFVDYSGTSKTTRTASATIYNNATSGTVTAPTQNTYTGWTTRGWTTGTSANASTVSSYSISANTTFYGLYQRTLTLSYNANGGSPTPSSQTGTQYANSYSISSTKNPSFTLASAISKPGSTFDGWAMGSTSGTKYSAGSSITISANTTMYATWKTTPINIYNLGEETYSFENFHGKYIDPYGRVHASQCYDPNCTQLGHCFGMSITSAGYYLGALNKSLIGSSNDKSLFTFSFTDAVKKPIHYYQVRQGSYSLNATVAGGNWYKYDIYNINSDWNQVINYVKSHNYDDKGMLQIGFRKNGEGGHAINFLRYSVVNGQERIYAYDNNFPTEETYLYKGSDGKVYQTPEQTFSGAIDCVALRDVNKYYSLVDGFDLSRVIYAGADEIMIENADVYAMECGPEVGEYYMYELSSGATKAKIVPQKDNATFTYLDRECNFDTIDDDTYGIVTLSSMDEGGDFDNVSFTIYNAPGSEPTPDPQSENRCPWCGGEHTGFFGGIVGFFHRIFAAIFGARY